MSRMDYFKNLIDLFDVSHTGLWEMAPDNRVVFYNTKFYEQFDIPVSDSTLDDWIRLIHPEDRVMFSNNVEEHRASDVESFLSEYRVINKDGQYMWIEAKGMMNSDENGQMFGTHTDITVRKEYESKLYDEAYIDTLTRLPNAKKLIIDIEKDLVDEKSGTLLFIDFSYLNHMLTIYGQAFIDRLITEGTQIIQNIFSEIFDVYRFIPFVFSFKTNHSIDQYHVSQLCNQLEKEISQLNIAFDLSSDFVYKAVLMSYPQEEYFPSCEDMFNRIFLTLEGMEDHDTSLAVYTNETKKHIHRKMFIETNLIKALEDQEFFPVFQPIVSSTKKELLGFEALCRWTNSKWGPIYPDEFIGTAEKSGAIIRVGAFIIDAACSFIRDYNETHQTDLSISVNASVVELLNPTYSDYIRSSLEKYQLHPSNLIIEITESQMLDNNTYILDQLTILKNEGVGIAIDDFGTGYSSINTIFSTPITEVKIDRDVMLQIGSQPIVYDFIKSLVGLCQKYGIFVVAEGIEDREMEEICLQLNVNYLQGYKFSQPLSLEKAIKYKY